MSYLVSLFMSKVGAKGLVRLAVIALVLSAEGAAVWTAYRYGKGACDATHLKNAVTVEQKVRAAGTRARATDTSRSLRDGSF